MTQTFREMNLAVFRGEPTAHPLFQPRFEPWYDWQTRFGDMPQAYRDMGIRAMYDELGCSMRYVDYYTGAPLATGARLLEQGGDPQARDGDRACRDLRDAARRADGASRLHRG